MSSSSNDVELRRMGRGQQLRDEDEIDMEAGHERAVNSDLLRPPRSAFVSFLLSSHSSISSR